jgi:arylsulfatase
MVTGPQAKFFGMIANIDDNVGRLLKRLHELGLEKNTLIVFLNDNGGTVGCKVFNAGMKGEKVTARNGGTWAMSLWRWPGRIKPGACDRLTAHVDIFPTLAELAGASIPPEVRANQDGFSLVPLLQNPKAPWHDERFLFTHVGRWPVGVPPEKFGPCSVRWQQYLLFRAEDRWALYDLKADPGEQQDLATNRTEVVAKLELAYDRWWMAILPCLENETAYQTAPQVNPFHELHWKQYGRPAAVSEESGIGRSKYQK